MGVFDHEFVVDGIRYRAVPDTKAAKIARKLYKIFKPYKGQKSSLGKGAEASKSGRLAIGKYIYLPTAGYKKATELLNKLGTGSESYWSSWFFGRAYGHNPEYRKLNTVGKYLSGYPHSAGMKNRLAIEKNPEKYIGKTEYVMFSFSEAPVDVGDSIIAINRSNPHSFSTFKSHASQMKSHGRVVASVSGGKALLHGGNESGGVGMDKLPLQSSKFAELDSSGRLIHPSSPNRYTGLLKKVVVLGPNTTGVIAKSYARKTGLVAFWSAASYALFRVVKNIRDKS